MIWIILTVIVVFLIASAMPLIRQNMHDRKQRKLIIHRDEEDIEQVQPISDDEDDIRRP